MRSASSVQNRWTSRPYDTTIFHEYRSVYLDFLSRVSTAILVLAPRSEKNFKSRYLGERNVIFILIRM